MERIPRTKQPEGKQISNDQIDFLHDIDCWFEDLFPRLQQDRDRMHEIELRPGGSFNLEQEPRKY